MSHSQCYCESWYWNMHVLIFETSMLLLAGSTRLMELHTNRAAKHRCGKQRCKTSNMTVLYANMNLQIRSMFDAEPTSAELISSRKRFVERPCHQWNTQVSNATHASMALEERTPNTHPRAELPPQESGDNSTKQGWMPKLPKGR